MSRDRQHSLSNEFAAEPASLSTVFDDTLESAPRYLIFFLIFYAPFCYGLRDGAGEEMFVTIGFTSFFIFSWKCFLDGKWPRIPTWMLFCMTFIALQGLWMTLNADSYYRWHRELITVRILDPAPFPDLPGSRDRFASPIQFYPQLAVFSLMIVVIDMSKRHRRQVITAVVVCAVVFGIVGIIMKIGGPKFLHIYWQLEEADRYNTVFAAYRYHGNAATFLIIGFALNVGLLLQLRSEGQLRLRNLASAGIIILTCALAINTSRAGWILALMLAALYTPRFLTLHLASNEQEGSRLKIIVAGLVGIVAMAVVIGALFSVDENLRVDRFLKTSDSLANRFPLFIFLEMIPDTPIFGFGPGAFSLVFPKYQLANPLGFRLDKYLNEAHQDFFQIYFDWGLIAFVCWLVILFGPLKRAGLNNNATLPMQLHFSCLLAAAAVLLHAMIDFPLQITSLLFFLGLVLACLVNSIPEQQKSVADMPTKDPISAG